MNIIQHRRSRIIRFTTDKRIKWIIPIICLFYLTGCQSTKWYSQELNLQNWKYSDVRELDLIDTVDPHQDLIALYSRIRNQYIQLRVDFLEMPISGKQDMYFLFDTNPGGLPEVKTSYNQSIKSDVNWDYLIKIPRTGNVVICNDRYSLVEGMALLVVRDPSLQSIVLSFSSNVLPINASTTYLQVLVTAPESDQIIDKSDVISMDAPSPSRAQIFFAFWNTFSSSTPAQALRSWMGAHAGPISSRHGLRYLLDAASRTNTPIYLADLFTPENISALDYLNVLPEINRLLNKGVIFTKKENEIIGNKKTFSFINDKNNVCINNDIDFSENDYAKFLNVTNCALIPQNNFLMNLDSDLLLSCKSLLLNYAIHSPSLLLILGGDFSVSLLGDPSVSIDVFRYIVNHPWIQIVSIADIADNQKITQLTEDISIPNDSQESIAEEELNSQLVARIKSSLMQLPKNKLSDLAKTIYQSLMQPAPEQLLELRFNYLGQIGFLINAAQWSDNPVGFISCDQDLDFDGRTECILSNKNIYVVIDPDGGYIPYVFSIDSLGVHQIIGPSWEFMVGISDNSEWDISDGILSDPGQILGAFIGQSNDLNRFNYVMEDNEIIVFSDKMAMRKSVTISQDSIHIEIQSTKNSIGNFCIPLVVDPWVRFDPGWGDLYTGNKSADAYRWGISSGEEVEIRTPMLSNVYSFNETRSALAYDENPNFDYTRGHYLPFPMALVEIKPSSDIVVNIIVNP